MNWQLVVSRIITARLEIGGLVNASTLALTTFGMDISEPRQMAILGLVNAAMIVAYRLMTGRPVSPPPT